MKNRKKITINDNWEFTYHPANQDTSAEHVQQINIPHSWNGRANGIYSKRFILNTIDDFKKCFIEFEGASSYTEVIVNGKAAGNHKGGFSAFRFDITDLLTLGVNLIQVKVNNTFTSDILPVGNEGDFTKFGGLYRSVNLIFTSGIHIDMLDYGADGAYVDTSLQGDNGHIRLRIRAVNEYEQKKEITACFRLIDENNAIVCKNSTAAILSGKERKDLYIENDILSPKLWNGIMSPILYKVEITLKCDDEIDTITLHTGFRCINFSFQGTFLNGRKYFLRGVNYHPESYENGWGMNEKEFERDYTIIREMGANAIRMAHYQHSDFEYTLCDKSGLLVWTEIPYINHGYISENGEASPTDSLCENAQTQLTELLLQTYNHISVAIIGISNELYDIDSKTCELYSKLCKMAHDGSGRYVAYADNLGTPENDQRGAEADIVGYNRYEGWYYDKLGSMKSWLENRMKELAKPTIVSEYGAGGAITQHCANPSNAVFSPNGYPHPEEFQEFWHRKTYSDFLQIEGLCGVFIWCMFDFSSEGRCEGDTIGENDKGLVTRTRDGFKSAYRFYRSVWKGQ